MVILRVLQVVRHHVVHVVESVAITLLMNWRCVPGTIPVSLIARLDHSSKPALARSREHRLKRMEAATISIVFRLGYNPVIAVIASNASRTTVVPNCCSIVRLVVVRSTITAPEPDHRLIE